MHSANVFEDSENLLYLPVDVPRDKLDGLSLKGFSQRFTANRKTRVELNPPVIPNEISDRNVLFRDFAECLSKDKKCRQCGGNTTALKISHASCVPPETEARCTFRDVFQRGAVVLSMCSGVLPDDRSKR